MLKKDELTNPNSCMSKARDDEMTFVLLGRDIAAPIAIQAWIDARIRFGKNTIDDEQIKEARKCIGIMMSTKKDTGIKVDPVDELVNEFYASMEWTDKTTVEDRELILGNIRGFAVFLQCRGIFDNLPLEIDEHGKIKLTKNVK